MRRNDRARDRDFSTALIDRCSHGVMALSTGEDTPYCLPLSFVRVGDCLYFHCALEGRKLDLLRCNPRVCVTFVGRDEPALEPPANYTTFFQSAIVTGSAQEVTEEGEKTAALRALCQRLLPQHMEGDTFQRALASLPATGVWKIQMDHISGKEKTPHHDI